MKLAVAAFAVVALAGAGAAVVFGTDVLERVDSVPTPELGSSSESVETENLEDAEAAIDSFVAALSADDLSTVTFSGSTTEEVVADYETATSGMGSFTLQVEPEAAVVTGPLQVTAPVNLTWTLPADVVWENDAQVTAEQVNGEWLVRWERSILESTMKGNDRLDARRLEADRGAILGRDGTPLVEQVALVEIGIQPSRVEDLPSLVATLAEILDGVDPTDLTTRVNESAPDGFVPVDTLRREDYLEIRDQVFPLPGTIFRESSRPTVIDDTLARALLGRSGEVTAEVLEENPGLFKPGDFAGLSGLQRQYNEALAGRPGTEIGVVRGKVDPSSTTTGTGLTTTSEVQRGPVIDVMFTSEPTHGQQVITTLDPALQRAAEDSLNADSRTSALVVMQVSTGDILVLANGPRGSTFNGAMVGQYPPGSIFKVVSGYAIMRDRFGPDGRVDCPPAISINGGRPIGNAGGESFGNIDFGFAFAHSCNTAFINATAGFESEVLRDAGLTFGIGNDYQIGIPSFSGSVPVTNDASELAFASFGQGKVLVSPLSGAVMASTAAGGVYRSPRLVLSPSPGEQEVIRLEPGPAADLRDVMRDVVVSGTAPVMRNTAGGPVSGKTGTAEFGTETGNLRSHAWFVGFQGDLAFAVFVEAGEFGGSTAAPLVKNFLNNVAGRPISPPVSGQSTSVPAEETADGAADQPPAEDAPAEDAPAEDAPAEDAPAEGEGDEQGDDG